MSRDIVDNEEGSQGKSWGPSSCLGWGFALLNVESTATWDRIKTTAWRAGAILHSVRAQRQYAGGRSTLSSDRGAVLDAAAFATLADQPSTVAETVIDVPRHVSTITGFRLTTMSRDTCQLSLAFNQAAECQLCRETGHR